MDFGVVGLDGWLGSSDTTPNTTFVNTLIKHNSNSKQDQQSCYGSELLKQDRSCTTHEEDDDFRSFKVLKTQSSSKPSTTTNNSLFFDVHHHHHHQQQQQQMLSFSSPTKSEALNHSLPYRNSGYSSNYGSCFNGVNMHGSVGEVRWPFTASQYMELEQQALIYKYITANIPIPTQLLIPIKRALDSAAAVSLSAGLLRPNSLGWGAFQLGFSSNNDPEPGRCRRTDGKKWRCSRDAVANQKYCERHMNRGRHRSRKPVEGRAGHSATTTAKPVPVPTSVSSVVFGASGGRETNSLTIANQQDPNKNLQSLNNSPNVSAATSINGMFYNKGEKVEDTPALSMVSSNLDLKLKGMPFLVSKQQCLSEATQIGLAASDSHPCLSQNSSSFMSYKNFGSSQVLADHETVSQSCLRQFMDDWPKSHSELGIRSDRTQLADFMSSTSSPNHKKGTLSPLRLSREFDPIQMGLGVGSVANESSQRQANWIPISLEASVGGPLGEVLNSTSNSASVSRNSSALNLMSEGWENSPRLGSSPTGVLQKTAFASVSSSSAGSSPRGEHSKVNEGAT